MREIPISEWGKDHWSTFAYAACRVIDYQGQLNPLQMRDKHGRGAAYPTFLKAGKEQGHDDYDCLIDLEREGFLVNTGTGLHPVVRLTEKGLEAWRQMTAHKQNGGNFGEFVFSQEGA